MAFHGSRGSSRGGNRGGGVGSRGRGSGSRGSSSRGRGRGGFRGGRNKPVFDSSRVAQQKETGGNEQSEEEDAREEEEEELSSESSSDDEEEVLRPVRSYAALMRSLAAENVTAKAKRRKLDHVSETTVVKDYEKNGQNELDIAEDADRVDEPEEGPETATDGFLEGNEAEETEDASDPFESHFANPNDNILVRRLKSVQLNQWSTQKLLLPKVGRALINIPQDGDTSKKTPSSIAGPGQLKLKQKLADIATKLRPSFDDLEIAIAQLIFNYQDVLYCQRSPANSEDLRRLTCLHAVNHVFKTRDRVIKNNARLTREENNDELELRDQGFTRPKVLMILPTRESCVRMVNMIISLCEPDQQENRKRFDDSYVQKDDVFSDDKTEDFRELFGGNDDDMFRLGLKFTRKTIKYFSQFYNSDIIFTSPLGMRMTLGGTEDKKGDSDFLSSIEMVIVDQADALLMQNWEHMEYIFEHLNLQPKEAHGCDFSRVRSWYLDNNAKYFRQTIALSAFNSSELNTLFYTQSQNWAGKVKITVPYPGSIQDLGIKVKQTFSRLESPSLTEDSDTRFTYFTTTIIPALTRRAKDSAGTVIVVPSYADFTRVRNYLANSPATSSLSFGIISEFTPVPDVARARSHFYSGRHSILIYTERAHHFKRYKLRGVRKVIFYGLPENPTFYKEMVGGYLRRSLQEGKLEPGEGSVRAIFSKWDQLKLERIVGTERVRKMIIEKGDTFDFV